MPGDHQQQQTTCFWQRNLEEFCHYLSFPVAWSQLPNNILFVLLSFFFFCFQHSKFCFGSSPSVGTPVATWLLPGLWKVIVREWRCSLPLQWLLTCHTVMAMDRSRVGGNACSLYFSKNEHCKGELVTWGNGLDGGKWILPLPPIKRQRKGGF